MKTLHSRFDPQTLAQFSPHEFAARAPFAFWVFDRLLRTEDYVTLAAEWPHPERFETHRGIPRVHGQRPHNRRYLAYETSLYHGDASPVVGVIRDGELSAAWRSFVAALQGDAAYHRLLADALGTADYALRFAWHIGGTGDEVSPHVDAPEKLGTHIFYFTDPSWDPEWGGETRLLGDRRSATMAPDFAEFGGMQLVPLAPNRSLLMRNAPEAWHGVEALRCPETAERRLFNVVIERTTEPASARSVRRRFRLRRR